MVTHSLWRCIALALGALALAGCGSSSEDEAGSTGDVVRIGAVSSDLTVQQMVDGAGNLLTPTGIKGTYGAHCKLHAGQVWDLALNNPNDRSLEVVLNDTFANCPLTMTAIQSKLGPLTIDSMLDPPIVLGNAYAAQAAKVDVDHTPIFAFYTNAKLSGLTDQRYTNDFSIGMIYSDDAEVCGLVAPPAVYATVTAVATGSAVPPPDYGMGFDSLKLMVDADALVQTTSSGNVVLKVHEHRGEEWRIFDETAWCCGAYSFASIDALYKSGDVVASGTIATADDLSIPWSSFDLGGKKLPKSRSVVVKHTGDGGVYSYELLQVLFPGPTN